MKRVLALILSMLMIVSLAACTSGSEPVAEPSSNEPEEAAEDLTPGWPADNMRMIVSSGAGGSTDLSARILANELGNLLGTNIVVENITGGGQWNGWSECINSKADGNTFCYVGWPTCVLAQYNELAPQPYGRENFAFIASQVYETSGLCVRADDERFTDIQSVMDYGKEHGLMTACSTKSIANGDSCFIQYWNDEFDANITIVPQSASSEGYASFLAGDLDIYAGSFGDFANDIDTGLVRCLGIASAERRPDFPDIPTFNEQGYPVEFGVLRGLAFPAGVDQAIVDEMTAATVQACENTKEELAGISLVGKTIYGQELEDYITEQMEIRLNQYGLDWDDKFM